MGVVPVEPGQGFTRGHFARVGLERPGEEGAGLARAAGGLGLPALLGPVGGGEQRLVAPEPFAVGLHRPFDISLAPSELGDAVVTTGLMGQLGEALHRPSRLGLDIEPSFQGGGLRGGVAALLFQPRAQFQTLARFERPRAELPRGFQGLGRLAGTSRPLKPGFPDRRVGACLAAALQPERGLIPTPGVDGQPGLSEPDPLIVGSQFSGLLQGLLQAFVRHPIAVEIAELPEDAGWIIGHRQFGVVKSPNVVESDLDLIEMA